MTTTATVTPDFDLYNVPGMAYSTAETVNALAKAHEGLTVNGHRVVRPTALVQPANGWGTGKVSVLVEGKRVGSQRMLWFSPGESFNVTRVAD